ncbi:hypothetical protein [Vibrio sp. PNB22_4_1]
MLFWTVSDYHGRLGGSMLGAFVNHHFSAMSKDEVNSLIYALNQIMDELPKSIYPSEGMNELAALKEDLKVYAAENRNGQNKIDMRGRIDKYPLAALLCTSGPKSHKKRFKQLKAFIVMLSIQSFYNEDSSFHSSTLSAMRVVRMLDRDRYFPLLAHLPKSISNFGQFEEALSNEIKALKQCNDESGVMEWLKSLYQLTSYVNNGQKTRRHRSNGQRQSDKKPSEWIEQISDPDEPIVTLITPEPKLPRHSAILDTEEIERRHHRAGVELEITGEPALSKVWRGNVAGHIVTRSAHLIANSGLLTTAQIGQFLHRCLERDDDKDQLLLFVVLSGLLPNDFPELVVSNGYAEAMLVQHWLPTSSLRLQTKDVLNEVEGEFFLPCFPLSESAVNLSKTPDIIDRLNQHLSEHYSNIGCIKITLHRLARVFSAFVQQHAKSTAKEELLTHRNKQKHVGLYYLGSNTKPMMNLQQEYADWLNQQQSCSPITLTDQTLLGHCSIGSPLFINLACIKPWLEQGLTMINKLRKSRLCDELVLRHNAMTAYLHVVLALSTGGRVRKEGFGRFHDYCLLTGQCYIADKDTSSSPRQRRVSRLVVIPPIALALLKHYQNWLKALSATNHQWPEQTMRHLTSALNSECGFLFYLNEEDATVESSGAFTYFKSYFPLPSNWQRHWLRSYLEEQHLDDSIIDACMGHNRGFGLTHGQYSQISFQNMKEVALIIEELLTSLGVKLWR